MPESTPEPDEFGRYRVTDKDLDRRVSSPASARPPGNYSVLKQPASDVAGDPLPPEFNATKPLSNHSGESAPEKESK